MSKTAFLMCACFLLISLSSSAQTQQNTSLPTSPGALTTLASATDPAADEVFSSSQSDQSAAPQQSSTAQSSTDQPAQTKRILGVIPNFRAVNANQHLPPQTVKDKFMTATEDSFDYSSILLPAALAGYSQAVNETPEFGQGAKGYGRYFWHSFVDQTSENYFVEFIVPTITHEDTRYYTLGSGGFWKRTGYALSRAVITRSDSGNEVFNAGEVIGAGASAGVSNLYYPSKERTFGNTAQKWGLNVGIDAATFVFKEFWPDINAALFHTKD